MHACTGLLSTEMEAELDLEIAIPRMTQAISDFVVYADSFGRGSPTRFMNYVSVPRGLSIQRAGELKLCPLIGLQ